MNDLGRFVVAVLASSVLLSGCGFHMVGASPLPEQLKSVYIDLADSFQISDPPVAVALQKRIERRGGEITSKLENADSVLRISELTEKQEVESIGPDGKAIEYRLVTKLRYELDKNGVVLVQPDTLIVSRDYSFNAGQILAKEVEQARLRNYLQDEMADLLLLRLEADLQHPPKS